MFVVFQGIGRSGQEQDWKQVPLHLLYADWTALKKVTHENVITDQYNQQQHQPGNIFTDHLGECINFVAEITDYEFQKDVVTDLFKLRSINQSEK